ncbi:MAG: proline--tRNA ligase [Legionellales bacterium]|nr:proline--tRNA ligase [Legionellales bacterium]
MIVTPQQCGWTTLKETPSDATLTSHQLMLRAGLITASASGIYTWLPIGLRVLRRIEQTIRETLEPIAQEMLMPMVQPAALWQTTERWQAYGPELLRFQDRHARDFCLGPTHEEIVTHWAKFQFNSYKQLPVCVYQIQTKFRDEIRPRFGVMRAREFMMKDAYSFHLDQACLNQTYEAMHTAYQTILVNLGLKYRVVEADSGSIGGKKSHEFQVISNSGEDAIVYCEHSEYAANIEQAHACPPTPAAPPEHSAPARTTSREKAPQNTLKLYVVKGTEHPWVCLALRTEDTLNVIQSEKHPLVKSPLQHAPESTQHEILAPLETQSIQSTLPIIADTFAAALTDYSLQLNQTIHHLYWHRDLVYVDCANLRTVQSGDPSPDGQGPLKIERGIEVGHIFQLGTCYSEPLGATVLNASGQATPLLMGCYGIGVSRLVAATIEQHHDEYGICWPRTLAPFDVHILGFQSHKNPEVEHTAQRIATQLSDAGYDVFLDLRQAQPGALLADADLLGLPFRCVISPRTLEQQGIEFKARAETTSKIISEDQLLWALQGL